MQLLQTPLDAATEILTKHLHTALETHPKVLFLVSGGSNIAVAVTTLAALSAHNRSKITVALVDERYGPVGHADSNFTQLQEAGLAHLSVKTIAVLQPSQDLVETAEAYNHVLERYFADHYVVALFGIGPDGHTAGILPHSPAALELPQLVTSYVSDPYQRITTTFTAIRRVNEAFVMAYGEAKAATLKLLATTSQSLAEQPAQIFKELPAVYVFNDQIGETA